MSRKSSATPRTLRRQEKPFERQHSMNVEIGLYFLRYVRIRSFGAPPVISVTLLPADAKNVSLVSVPGNPVDCLAAPGDYMVVRAQQRAAITLSVRPSVPGGPVDAEVRLERVTAAEPHAAAPVARIPVLQDPSAPQDRLGSRLLAAAPDIQILAHVAHRGDVLARQGEWICGPDLPVAIEGFEIRWPNKPADLELTYSVRSAARGRQQSEERRVGEFAGTRGRAAPVVGLQLSLSGPGAAQYEARCDALFLGSQIVSRRGSTITLVGPRAVEPLVGLRLSIETTSAEHSVVNWATVPKIESDAVNGRVRVYRSGPSSQGRTGRAHA